MRITRNPTTWKTTTRKKYIVLFVFVLNERGTHPTEKGFPAKRENINETKNALSVFKSLQDPYFRFFRIPFLDSKGFL